MLKIIIQDLDLDFLKGHSDLKHDLQASFQTLFPKSIKTCHYFNNADPNHAAVLFLLSRHIQPANGEHSEGFAV